MWLKNLIVYRLPANWDREADDLEKKLASQPLQPCGSFDMESRGWTCPQGEGSYLYRQLDHWLLALGVEQKLLPASVIRQAAEERAAELAKKQPYPVGRKQMRDIKEQVTAQLLVRALTRRRTTFAWIDVANGWLAIDAAGEPKAEQFLETLRKAEDGFPSIRLDTARSPAAAMTQWVVDGEVPGNFTIDEDLELRAPDASKATVRYARHGLDGQDIRDHIKAGKSPVRLGLTWNDKISFVLTEQLHIKRLAFLDILKREGDTEVQDEAEQFDLDFALMTGELSQLLDDLVLALGGHKQN
jgi:recombination associated protein RdgC